MSIDFLFTDFDRLIQSSESVHRLRRFILDLAVRGKLVPQDPNDEPALELLKRIEQTRDERHKRKLALIEIDPTKTDFDLPDNWNLAPLGVLGGWAIGTGFPKSEQGRTEGPYFFLKVSDMNLPGNEKVIVTAQNRIDDEVAARIRAKVHSVRTIIFPKIGGAIATNKRRILSRPSAIDNNCLGITISSEINLNWAYLLLTSLDFTRYQAGTAVPALQQGVLERISVAIPPFPEQRRIVAKVDELMAFCDRLEATRAEREATRDRLTAASLARLNAPGPNPAMFQHDVAFALNNLAPLTTRPDQIKALRQAILNLAVRGRLSVQESSEGDVEDLLNQLSIQQKRLIARKKLKRSVVTCNLKNQDNLASIPNSWRWVPLGKLISFGPQNGISPRATNSPDTPRAITLTATTSGTFDASHFKHVEADVPADSEYWLRDGDLLFQRGNTREYVGIAAYYSEASGIFLYPDLIIKVRLLHGLYLPYVHLALVSPGARTYFSTNATGAQETMPKINQQMLLNAPVPLPPLAEQHRIVTKVDELMALCDRLEASLVTGGETRGRLVKTLLHETLAPGTVVQTVVQTRSSAGTLAI